MLFSQDLGWQSSSMVVFGMGTLADMGNYQRVSCVIGVLKSKLTGRGMYRSIGSCENKVGIFSLFGSVS